VDAGFALQHAPGFAAFHGEQHHLPAHGKIFNPAVDVGLDVAAKAWNSGGGKSGQGLI
jgi:hypothetical protein